jgi:hypothetical protein
VLSIAEFLPPSPKGVFSNTPIRDGVFYEVKFFNKVQKVEVSDTTEADYFATAGDTNVNFKIKVSTILKVSAI